MADRERRSRGEHKYYLSDLPIDAPLEALANPVNARWLASKRTSS